MTAACLGRDVTSQGTATTCVYLVADTRLFEDLKVARVTQHLPYLALPEPLRRSAEENMKGRGKEEREESERSEKDKKGKRRKEKLRERREEEREREEEMRF